MVFGVQLRSEPQGAAHHRTPPKTHICRVHQSNVTAHIHFNEPVALRTAAIIDALPFL